MISYLPPIKRKIPDLIIKQFGGINRLDPLAIGDSFSTSQRNMSSDNYPSLSIRAGYSLIGTTLSGPIQGMSNWKNSELHVVSGGNWYKLAGTSWTTALASGLNTSAPFSFANFKGGFTDINMIATNGVDAPRLYNGSTVTNLSGAPATGNYVISYDNRVFMVVGNLLYASGLNLATDWSSTGDDSSSYQISVDSIDGETISGLSPGIGHVTIFKPNSMYELFGSSPSDVRISPITFEVGAINNQCIVALNGVIYFIHRTGIYQYGGGSRPSRSFSQPVQAFIDEANPSYMSKCCAGTDGKKLYFSIPSASATKPDTTLVYDPAFDMWNVYKDFTPLQFTQSAANFYIGLSDGRVIQMGGSADNGAAISWEWVSKPFGADSYSQKIRWTRMWIFCDVPIGSTLNAYVSPSASGDSDWLQVGSISAKSSLQNSRIVLAPSAAMSNYLRIKFSGTGPVKIHEWDRMQVEFPIV